ncbi:MAG: hypothetical protein ABFC57_13905 [Veillonellales bacterium]
MTTVAWGTASLFITWALFRNGRFDFAPIARNRIIESMMDETTRLIKAKHHGKMLLN